LCFLNNVLEKTYKNIVKRLAKKLGLQGNIRGYENRTDGSMNYFDLNLIFNSSLEDLMICHC